LRNECAAVGLSIIQLEALGTGVFCAHRRSSRAPFPFPESFPCSRSRPVFLTASTHAAREPIARSTIRSVTWSSPERSDRAETQEWRRSRASPSGR
jgi:hypothetical protein